MFLEHCAPFYLQNIATKPHTASSIFAVRLWQLQPHFFCDTFAIVLQWKNTISHGWLEFWKALEKEFSAAWWKLESCPCPGALTFPESPQCAQRCCTNCEGFSNVSSNCLPEQMRSHKSCNWTEVKSHCLHLKDFSPEWIFRCVLKLPDWAEAKSHWLHLKDFQMCPEITWLNRGKVT